MTHEFRRRVHLSVSAAEAFAWHERPGAFERLNAPWSPVRVRHAEGGIRDGARVSVELPGLLPIPWTLEHHGYRAGATFSDRQRRGPFAAWDHEHRFEDQPGGSVLEDRIAYAMPWAPLGEIARPRVESMLARLFAWRHRVTAADLDFRARLGLPPCRVVLAGASGMIGQALSAFLTTQGHQVLRLVRRPARMADEREWDPARGRLEPAVFDGVHAVINLAGASIAGQRWSASRLGALIDSRVGPTQLLARTLASCAPPPTVFISASAIGIYGDRGEQMLDESSAPGAGFLSELAQAWERAAEPAAAAGLRVVHPRIGLVLTPLGGALEPLLRATRFGAGGPLGSGRQWWSWITLDDVLRALTFAIADPALSGPVVLAAPAPVRQHELARALGRVLARPSLLPAPRFALRMLLGEMADEMLLASQRATPTALERAGFPFLDPSLDPALRAMLGHV